jgi:DHA1 family inner membrane transport protein
VDQEQTGRRIPLALYALATAAFAIGTTEFVVVGLLPRICADLGVAVSTAGLLVTGYAAGVAVGGIALTLATRRLPPKPLLIALMAVFSVGHVVMAAAPTFEVLLAARIVTASCHGAFFGFGAVVASGLVPADRRSRAIALMFGGLTVATVVGVPAGTMLGEAAGWRAPFVAVAVLAAAAAVAVAVLLPPLAPPSQVDGPRPAGRGGALAAALATTVLGWGSQFVVFAFLSAYLLQITGFGTLAVTGMLLVFGVASAIGNAAGGRASDAAPRTAVAITLGCLAFALVAFWALDHNRWATIGTVFGWGIAGFALIPALQSRVLSVTGEASVLASASNIAAFNVGIAAGSGLGALLVDRDHLAATPLVAAVLAAVAVPLSLLGLPRRQPGSTVAEAESVTTPRPGSRSR